MCFVYILQCNDGSLYTGITNDIQRRFDQHKRGQGGHYTKSKGVEKILYTEEHANKSAALKRELQIKGWAREEKLNLIRSGRP